MVGFFIAVLSGILMSVQGVFNTQVTKQSSVDNIRFCTAYSTLGLCSGMAFYGSEQSAEGTCGKAFLPAARRRDRCVYHLYGRCQHGKAGTCKGGHVYCDRAADQCLSDRTSGDVRCRKGAVFCQKTGGNGSGGHRRYCF